jgi:hypothetical protein
MKKIYLAFFLTFSMISGISMAQNNQGENNISLSQEKMNVFYSSSEDMIRLSYTIATPSPVEIKIVDITGNSIKTINLPMQFAGSYSEILERTNMRQGIYIMEMNWAGKRFIKRFVIS